VKWGWIVGACVLAGWLVARRHKQARWFQALELAVVAGALAIGVGVVHLPNLEKLIEDAGTRLGSWTYLLVGALAFAETGAFLGFIAPGETAVIVGGLVAGQGRISLLVLIAIVWTCAVLGDLTSYELGRRLGREWLLRHGERLKITEERLEQVEWFFERRGNVTILVGRFLGFVRPLLPFIAGTSRMPLRRYLAYDVLAAGAWSATFCVLGYVFWQSFSQLTKYVSRGLFAFGTFVAVVVAVVWLVQPRRSRPRCGPSCAAGGWRRRRSSPACCSPTSRPTPRRRPTTGRGRQARWWRRCNRRIRRAMRCRR
jgi:membrane protein DedA with SNARE-associated domain